jgi:hypothetical protein
MLRTECSARSDQLRQNIRPDLGGLLAVPEHLNDELDGDKPGSKDANSPL